MDNHITKLKKIFKKEEKIKKKQEVLVAKSDKIYEAKENIAFILYEEFIKENKTFNIDSEYFKIYIESNHFLAEELIFSKLDENSVDFKHKSIHRQNQKVNVPFNVKISDYSSSSVVIDKNQFNVLSKYFNIKIRI